LNDTEIIFQRREAFAVTGEAVGMKIVPLPAIKPNRARTIKGEQWPSL
jgi:hypothetical protein